MPFAGGRGGMMQGAYLLKPLFCPVKKDIFLDYLEGRKLTEYRLYGPRWNESTAIPGRRMIVSEGYSGRRICSRIKNFDLQLLDNLPFMAKYYPLYVGRLKSVICINLEIAPW